MKYIRQFFIIAAISLAAEILHHFIPLMIPSSIYGMVLMFVLLMTGAVKLEQVDQAGHFLIDVMPLMFIPAGVGLIDSWTNVSRILIPALILIVISTFLVIGAAGKTAQTIMTFETGEEAEEEAEEADKESPWEVQ